jgi:hypothetical protein
MNYIFAAFAAICGAILLFGGWKLYKNLIVLLGLLVGAAIAGSVALIVVPANPLIFLVAVAIGAIIGAISFKVVDIAAFIVLGAVVGFLIGQIVLSFVFIPVLKWILCAISAGVFALLALMLKKAILISATALLGSIILIGAIGMFFGIDAQKYIESQTVPQNGAILIVAIAIVGAIFQIMGSKKEKKSK